MAVYFIQAGDGPVKIGFSVNPVARLRALQTDTAVALHLIAVIDGDTDEEARMHARFATHRIRREWFEPHPDLLAFAAEQGVTLPPALPEPEPAGQLEVREIAAAYAALIPAVVAAYGVDQIAAWAEVSRRAVEGWRDGTSKPQLPAFIELAKHVGELRSWLVEQLSVEEDPTRALAVIANALARRQS